MAAVKPVMLMGIDESSQSFYALTWTLDHFFAHPDPDFQLVVLHSKATPSSVLGLSGPGAGEVLPFVEVDLKRSATRVMEKAKELVASKPVEDVQFDIVEGDPRDVLCEAVDTYHASVLVLGSHGYGVIKRAVLGSISDFCAHHAHCSVMIVKKPKNKH